MQLVKEALQIFLRSLPVECTFNIFGFGRYVTFNRITAYSSQFDYIFKESKEYNDSSLAAASDKCQSFQADLGGTDLLPVLNHISASQIPNTCASRELFILTGQRKSNLPYTI
jgi:hypothetical protein